jgi:hypothetical protein
MNRHWSLTTNDIQKTQMEIAQAVQSYSVRMSMSNGEQGGTLKIANQLAAPRVSRHCRADIRIEARA